MAERVYRLTQFRRRVKSEPRLEATFQFAINLGGGWRVADEMDRGLEFEVLLIAKENHSNRSDIWPPEGY